MRYFIYGYYGFGNFGDDLMLSAILHRIAARDADARFTVKCRAPVAGYGPSVEFLPADAILEAAQPAWRRAARYLAALFRALRGQDWLVIGGGALFLDKGALNKSLVMLWCLVLRARLMGLRIAVIGVSCDLLANPVSLWLTRAIFRMAHRVTVRDSFSYDYARYFGCRDLHLCADLAFASPHLTVEAVGAVRETRAARREAGGRPRIGLSLVDYFAVYEPDPVRRRAFIERMSTILAKHAPHADILYVSLQEGQGLGDDRMHAVLAETVTFAGYRAVRTLDDALGLCAELDGMLTMRYHLALLGAAFGVPVAVLSHELKLAAVSAMPGVTAHPLSDVVADAPFDPLADLLAAGAAPRAPDLDRLRQSAVANFDRLP